MKLLKIKDNKGYFLADDGEYQEIDNITPDDLVRITNLLLSDDVELEKHEEERMQNQAHQVVYKSIYSNLKSLKERKSEFIDKAERLYLEDYERYKQDLQIDQSDEKE